MMNQKSLSDFDSIRDEHIQLAKKLLSADGGKIYKLDMLAIGVINRSLSISSGIHSMIEQGNLLCAASLIRLQIDSALRFFATTLVDDPDGFCEKVFEGCHIRKMKDKLGNLMTDSYLSGKLSERFPWVSSVYEVTSGYVHFSEKHVFSPVSPGSREGTINIRISDTSVESDSIFHAELRVAFLHSTCLVLQCVGEWANQKEHIRIPENNPTFATSSE